MRPIGHEASTNLTRNAIAEDLRKRGKFDEARKLYEEPKKEAAKDLAPAPSHNTTKSAFEQQKELRDALEKEKRIREEREKKARGE